MRMVSLKKNVITLNWKLFVSFFFMTSCKKNVIDTLVLFVLTISICG